MAENSDKSCLARELAGSGASLSEIATGFAQAKPATKARTVNKVSWAQVGRVSEPGRYMFRVRWITITAEDIAIWEKYPNAALTKTARRSGKLKVPLTGDAGIKHNKRVLLRCAAKPPGQCESRQGQGARHLRKISRVASSSQKNWLARKRDDEQPQRATSQAGTLA